MVNVWLDCMRYTNPAFLAEVPAKNPFIWVLHPAVSHTFVEPPFVNTVFPFAVKVDAEDEPVKLVE